MPWLRCSSSIAHGPADHPEKPTFAIVPFTAAPGDEPLNGLAEQARNSIAHTMSQSGIPIRMIAASPQDPRTAGDFLISGEFSRSAGEVVATIRLDETAHAVAILSRRFEAAPGEVASLPERIGAQMAGNLSWAAPQMMLDRNQASDPTLLSELLQQADFTADPLQGYQTALRAAAKAPNSAIAQLAVAFDTAFMVDLLPRSERPQAVARALTAADRARALAPDFGDVYAPPCFLQSETRFDECENRLRAGKRVDTDAPFLNAFLARLVRSTGRFDEADELTRLSYSHDPYVPTKIGWMLASLEWAGDSGGARELYKKGVRWWPEYRGRYFRERLSGLLNRGDFSAIRALEQEVASAGLPDGYHDSAALLAAIKAKSAPAAAKACSIGDEYLLQIRCMIALSSLGDQDGAYAIADKLYPERVGRTPAETERIWLDSPSGVGEAEFITSSAAAPMRRDARYVPVARRIGLLNYWRSGRMPDFCRKNQEAVCATLRKAS